MPKKTKKTKTHDTAEAAQAVIEDGVIVIRLAVDAIPSAVRGGVDMMAIDPPFRVTNAKAFAKDVVRALNDEDEDGTTPIHRMFDAAFNEAAEWGADGIETEDDTYEDDGY